jgi:uncharacterized membrane protein YraQ (UPF0718 family)
MLPAATALKLASPSGFIGPLVHCGVVPLLIGSALHRVSLSGDFDVLRTPARFLDYYGLC